MRVMIQSRLYRNIEQFLRKRIQCSELNGRQTTFTFTIDCFPAFTKFNRKKKVMAVLQVLDQEASGHNYRTKGVMGHEGRTEDADVDKWYTKSIFENEAAEDEGFNQAGSVEAASSLSTGEFAGKQLSELMADGNVTLEGDTIKVTGTINKVPDWNEAFVGADQTGYYVPVALTGTKGQAIKMTTLAGPAKINVFGETGDTDTTMNLILAFSEAVKTREMRVYESKVAAEGDAENTKGKVYTVNCEECTFSPGA